MSTEHFVRRPGKLLQPVLLAMLVAYGIAALSQTITGNINGTVTDPSGAVVPKANVTATNVDTGVSVSAVTNGDGMYSIRFLQIGKYQVRVEVPGFKTQVFPVFTLEQGSTAKVDFKLAVGATSTVVEVQGGLAPLLNTEDAMTTTTLDSNTIENITNKGRNFSLFTALVPGAVNTAPESLAGNFATERDTSQVDEVGVNGNRAQNNNYILDGVEINETISNLIGYNPNLDALGEVKIVSANPSAEYGNANGSTVLAATKSGTNQFHGTAGIYIENYNLDANSWANKNKANPAQIVPINPYEQNIWSGAVGGPVLIPHLFNGRNKLFFFADYEGTRSQSGGSGLVSVLTKKMRTGDFSELLDPAIMCGGTCSSKSKLIQLYDPANNFAPYPNNQIPVTNPVVQFLVAHPEFYPLPNTAPTGNSPYANNYAGSQKSTSRNDQGDVKIDWAPTDKDRASFRYLQGEGSDYQRNPLVINFPTPGDYPAKGFTVNYIHTFSTRLINEFRCCFFRTRFTNSNPYDSTGTFGAHGNSVVGIGGPTQQVPGFAQQNFPNGGVSVVGSLGGGSDQVENIFSYADNLTYQRGRHMFKMGVQFERYQQNYSNANGGALGGFGFNGVFTSNPSVGAGNATTPSASGFGTADWVLDRVDTESYGGVTGKVGQRQWRDGYFFQDDWKLLPNLTLNLGVRYEYDQPIYEVNNKEDNPIPSYDGTGSFTMLTAGVNGASRALYNPTYHDILPRFGVEYQVFPRMVFSVGYGVTAEMTGTGFANRLVQNAPFQYTFSLQATPPSTTSGGHFFQETDGFSSTNPTYSGTTYQHYNQRLQPELVQNYNVTLQYQFGNTRMLKVGYVGEKGYHLINQYRGNQLVSPCVVGGVVQTTLTSPTCIAQDPSPFYKLVGQTGNVITTDSNAIMEYDSLQTQFRQTFWDGLEFTANFVYARGMTDSTGFQAVAHTNGTGVAPENSYNLPLNWGPIGQDERFTMNANAVYEFPFGRGHLYFNKVNHVVDEAINGWKIAGVAVAYSGFPETVTAATQNTQSVYNGAPQQRPNKVGILPTTARYKSNGNIYWYGNQTAATIAQAYVQPANGQFGTTKVGDLRGPGYQAYDFSLFKNFPIFREETLGFEMDAYNAFNHVNWGNVSTSSGSPGNFGLVNSVRGQSRTVQIAAKYTF
jgi:Carboxypeptidase regulatory-like domain